MKITFEHRDGELLAVADFELPRGTRAKPVFYWGQMRDEIGQIVAEHLNLALGKAIQAARAASYWEGRRDANNARDPRYIHPDTLDG